MNCFGTMAKKISPCLVGRQALTFQVNIKIYFAHSAQTISFCIKKPIWQQSLQKSVDVFAGETKKRPEEEVVLSAKTKRMEHWVIDAAKKIELPYKV